MGSFPVSEIFGPTVQGEGVDQGVPCYFVRFGGCDYKCDWCDTPHAVLPQVVKQAKRMTEEEIIQALEVLPAGPEWVVLSGGNPVLMGLHKLIPQLQALNYKVALETQGSKEKDWIYDVDRLCISPKPPSSGMRTDWGKLGKIMHKCSPTNTFLKVVVFDHTDYEYAKEVHLKYPHVPFFVSAGNDAGKTVGNPSRVDNRTEAAVKLCLADKAKWLANRIMVDTDMYDVRVQAQFHVLLWGNKTGV